MSDIKLFNGDCLEIMKSINDNTIDLVVTSPPYDNLRTYENENIEELWNFEKFKSIADELKRILKDGGCIVWIVNDATVNGSETLTSFKQALYFKEIGLNIHDTMIWHKQTFTDTGSLKSRYGNVFEYMFVIVKNKLKTFNPIKDHYNHNVGQKKHGYIRQQDGSMRKQSSYGKKTNEIGQRFNVWKINTCCSNTERTGHPGQFPLELIHDHIISWSNEDDLILDPFMGSGTTGVACNNLNRNFIGIEINENYFKIAKDRIDKEIYKKEQEKYYNNILDDIF